MGDLTRRTIFHIISLSLAGGDVVQTIPGTVRFYRAQWAKGRLTTVCFFYAMARYMSILSLIVNVWTHGAFPQSASFEMCKRIYMIPSVTCLLAAIAVQVLVYLRTVAISGRSRYVRFGLGLIMLLGFPVQIFGIVYHRAPYFAKGFCKGGVFRAGEPNWVILFFSANMTFDFIACATATYYIVVLSGFHQFSRLSTFFRHILRDGLLYFVVVFLVNLWLVLESAHVFTTGADPVLSLAIVLIAVQHLILSTHHITSVDRNEDSFRTSVSQGPPRFYTSEVELESDVSTFVQSHDKNVSLRSEGRGHRASTSDEAPALPMAE
ncbi:hypothetical protein B0H16DRAFT_204294 [Mycena metata]|uniref:Uncharacterized protein n=1 Tax=Mycena metata TaxID=1033252 RepID=A0AAD7HYS6_9AGAR|nr:hypothetical protein B0H16DRAFT_204294 [Mycena metata]